LRWCVLAVSCFLGGAAGVATEKDAGWDVRNYHYYNAYTLLHNRLNVDFAPAGLQSYHNAIFDLPFYALVQLFKPKTVGFIMGAVQGINGWLLFEIAMLVLSQARAWGVDLVRLAALACAAVGMYAPSGVGEFGGTMNDLWVCLFILTALWLSLLYLKSSQAAPRPPGFRYLAGAALCTGFCVGGKLTAAVFAPGLALMVLLGGGGWKERIRGCVCFGILALVGFLLAHGYWSARLYARFGNPIFPYFNSLFHSPYSGATDPSRGNWTAKERMLALTFPPYLIDRPLLVSRVPFRDCRYAVAYGLLLLWFTKLLWQRARATRASAPAGARRRQSAVLAGLVLFSVVSYIMWLMEMPVGRYALPLELVTPVLIVALCQALFAAPWAATAGFVCLAGVAAFMQPASYFRLCWSDDYFGVILPPIEDAPHTLALMTGRQPYAFLLPFFPRDIRFLRVESNHWTPYRTDRMQQEMRALIEAHTGPLFLLSPKENRDSDALLLRRYQLRIGPGAPVDVRNLLAPTVEWVRLTRTGPAPSTPRPGAARR
jgi:hypothetical protein